VRKQGELFLALFDGKKMPRWLPTSRCVYYAANADSRDHTPPKLLLRKPFPVNYRTVPACVRCNASWSLDEEYLRVTLAVVSFEPDLINENEEGGYIDRILSKKPFLDDRITNSLNPEDDGRVSFSPELDRLHRIFAKIACGLYALRYGVGHTVEEFLPAFVQHSKSEIPESVRASMFYWPGVRQKKWITIQVGVFEFLFAESWFAAGPPAWCFLNLHNTLFAAVQCPALIGKPRKFRLKAASW
jgi:hypothetical protein